MMDSLVALARDGSLVGGTGGNSSGRLKINHIPQKNDRNGNLHAFHLVALQRYRIYVLLALRLMFFTFFV